MSRMKQGRYWAAALREIRAFVLGVLASLVAAYIAKLLGL